eukprot:2391621-Pyramimonas_sp.AAC.1
MAIPQPTGRLPIAEPLLDHEGAACLRESGTAMMLDDDEFGRVCEANAPMKPCVGTVLERPPAKCATFLRSLAASGTL